MVLSSAGGGPPHPPEPPGTYSLKEKCMLNNCYNKESDEYYSPIISIDISELYLNNLNDIINFKFMISKNICKIHKIESVERVFEIRSLPYFLIFLLDIERSTYKNHLIQILNLFKNNIIINNYSYILKSIIFMPTSLHFTCSIFDLDSEIFSFLVGSNVYHDEMDNDGYVVLTKESIDLIKNKFPYIFLFKKII